MNMVQSMQYLDRFESSCLGRIDLDISHAGWNVKNLGGWEGQAADGLADFRV